ncbi:MAG: hypothetical protein QW607_12230 [Desulfurococcaceae archaeon]
MEYKKFAEFLLNAKKLLEKENNIRNLKRRVYISILIIQLSNGLRISEAVECMSKFSQDLKRLQYVRVRKMKKRDKIVLRECRVPEIITERDAELYKILFANKPQKHIENSVKLMLWYNFKIKSHDLRKAYINYMIKKDAIAVLETLKFQDHKNLIYYIEDAVEKAKVYMKIKDYLNKKTVAEDAVDELFRKVF